jgi:hypothetical protein
MYRFKPHVLKGCLSVAWDSPFATICTLWVFPFWLYSSLEQMKISIPRQLAWTKNLIIQATARKKGSVSTWIQDHQIEGTRQNCTS